MKNFSIRDFLLIAVSIILITFALSSNIPVNASYDAMTQYEREHIQELKLQNQNLARIVQVLEKISRNK